MNRLPKIAGRLPVPPLTAAHFAVIRPRLRSHPQPLPVPAPIDLQLYPPPTQRKARAEAAPAPTVRAEPVAVPGVEPGRPAIRATRFVWRKPADIPRRRWIYGFHYIRKFVSTTVATGGAGKTSNAVVEALAITTGRPLLGIEPVERAKVWVWNGEDPLEEMERRVTAAMLHYGIPPEEVEHWLFLDSGRTSEIILAHQTREGARIAVPVVEALEQTIRENQIGVVILDPFVSVHRVSENDNGMIDAVAKTIGSIADRTECAFDLNHHVRKTNGAEVTVEDGRGAVALLAAARSARVLNPMSKDEATKAGVDNRRLYFRVENGKANLTVPADQATWHKLEPVSLGNGPSGGDSVGVVTRWQFPNPLDRATARDLLAVQRRVSEGEWRKDIRAANWVGHAVAEVMGLDADNAADRATIKSLIGIWTRSGMFKVVARKDDNRRDREFVEVDQWTTD